MTNLNPKEELNHLAFEKFTRLFFGVSMLVLMVSFHFVYSTAKEILMEAGYSYLEYIGLALFSCFVGAIISIGQHERNWMGFAHFSAVAYLLALVLAMLPSLGSFALVQPLFLLTFVMLVTSSIILFGIRFRHEKQ